MTQVILYYIFGTLWYKIINRKTMNSNVKSLNTKEKLLKATIDLIQIEIIEQISVRKIIDKANVNISSVNYYYGSKEKLISEAIIVFFERTLKKSKFLCKENIPLKEKFKLFLLDRLELYLSNDFLSKQIFNYVTNSDNEIAQRITSFIKSKYDNDILRLYTDEPKIFDDYESFKMMFFQMMSCIYHPCISGPQSVKHITGIDLNDPQTREKYVDIILNRYFD